MKKQIIWSDGHTPRGSNVDPGATTFYNGKRVTEAELTLELGTLGRTYLSGLGYKVVDDPDDLRLAGVISFFRRRILTINDVAIDVHFNAFNTKATGVECIYPDKFTKEELALAANLASSVSTVLGIKNRGSKPEKDTARGKLGFFALPCTTVLLEVCFMDNPRELETYLNKKELVARSIANCLMKA